MDELRPIRVGSAVYRPLMDGSLTAEDIQKADEELNETFENKAFCLKALKLKLKEEKEMIPRMEDDFLVRFLRTRKYNVDRAYTLVKDYYRYRAKHPSLFPKPSSIERVLRANIFNYLGHRDSKGRAIFLMKIGLWDPDIHTFKEFLATGNMISELVLENEVTQINGFVGIWDFKDYGFHHFSHSCSPRLMWLLCNLMQDCFPGRFKCAYCVNCPPLADTVWKLFKPLLREKYRKRVLVFGNNWPLLHQYIHPSILPEEYGGKLPTSDCVEMVNEVLAHEQSIYEYNKNFGFLTAVANNTRVANDKKINNNNSTTAEECPA